MKPSLAGSLPIERKLTHYERGDIGEGVEGKQTAYQSVDTPMDDTASNAQRCKPRPPSHFS